MIAWASSRCFFWLTAVMRDGTTIDTVPADTPMPQVIAMMVGRYLEHADKHIPDTSANEVLLEARGLNRGRAIRDVSFCVRRGEIVGFAGLMGAGRTEFAMSLFGRAYGQKISGEVKVHGKPADLSTITKAMDAGLAYVTEDRKHLGLILGEDSRKNISLANLPGFVKKDK